jgi:diadenosine tetraphosphate (Ap4A) HIT family hydrolase
MVGCTFCSRLPKVLQNELAYTVYDINPVSPGHALIIPYRHVERIFDVTPLEYKAMYDLMLEMEALLQKELSPDGYNLWANCGKTAGQLVMHAHLHLIPRYKNQGIHIMEHMQGNVD